MMEESVYIRRIKEFEGDIELLKRDLKKVKHKRSISHIDDEIKHFERRKEQTEFKLWQLQKGK